MESRGFPAPDNINFGGPAPFTKGEDITMSYNRYDIEELEQALLSMGY